MTRKKILLIGFASSLLVSILSFPASAIAASSSHQLLADVNGDGFADAISFDKNTGDWWVSPSNGTGFESVVSRWMHGFGVGTSKQFAADVNGDGKADAVTFDGRTGDWWVSPSNGYQFVGPTRWIIGHGTGSTNQFVADVNADNKADAGVFFASSGGWYVGLSNGTAFSNGASNYAPPCGIYGFGVGTSNQFLADVNGDSKADAVTYDGRTGDWWAAVTQGSFAGPAFCHEFGIPSRWIIGHGSNATNEFVADVNGDGKADAVVFFGSNGNWYTGLSSGSLFDGGTGSGSFYFPPLARTGFGVGTWNQMLAHVNNLDTKADAVTFDKNTGDWWVSSAQGAFTTSDGSQFGPPTQALHGFGVGTD